MNRIHPKLKDMSRLPEELPSLGLMFVENTLRNKQNQKCLPSRNGGHLSQIFHDHTPHMICQLQMGDVFRMRKDRQ